METLIYPDESYQIRSAVYDVYSQLGCGLLESVYQEALKKELSIRGIPYKSQSRIPISYKGILLDQYFIADFICFGKIILEIKSVKNLENIHKAQLHNYLNLANCRLGLLINFNNYPGLKIERIVRG